MTKDFRQKAKTYSHICIIITFLVAFVIVAKPFVIPLALSFLIAIILNPFLRRLEGLGVNRILSIILVMVVFTALIGGLFTLSGFQLGQLLQDLPSIQQKVVKLFQSTVNSIQKELGIVLFEGNDWWKGALQQAGPFFSSFISTTSSMLTILVQIPIYIFLILLYKDKFTHFLAQIRGDQEVANFRVDEIKNVIQSYVVGMSIVICILAVLNSIGLLLLGIRYAVFFGIFSAVLTVVPYLGNFIGGLLPFLVALVTKDSAWYAVGVVAVYAVIQFLEGNFITPNIMGSRVSINPLVALLSLVVGGQLLGIVGVILAIPFMGVLRITFNHSPTLRPFVTLMEERHSKQE